MYILNFRRTVIIASICYFVIGCGGKKKSLGMDDEIRVVCSKVDEPLLRNYLSTIFNDTLYAPQPEPIFKIIFSRPESYQDLKKYSQIIVAAVNRNNSNPGYRLLQKLLSDKQLKNSIDDNPMLLTRDLYAKDQVFVILNASNEQHLFYEIEKNKKLLRMHYDEQFKIRGNKFIFEGNQIEIERKLRQDYKWSIKVPWGWEVLRNDIKNNFFWMGSEYPYKWISIKSYDGNFIDDQLLVGKQVWNYPIDNYKSIRFNDYGFELDRIYFNDFKGWQCSGVWESSDSLEAIGGPFYSYIFYDNKTDRTFHINTLVHNPGKSKSIYIRQMGLIAKSFKSFQESNGI